MANATARVGRAYRDFRNDTISHSYVTTAAATQLYTGGMIGFTVGGYLQKFDDTVSLRFAGIILEDHGNIKLPIGTAGDGTIDVDVKQPKFFELNIASVAITDIGRRVYAVDDQTGTLDPSATTYANHIGTVQDLVYAMNGGSAVANYALVRPAYNEGVGSQLQVFAANGVVIPKASTVIMSKGSALALTLVDPTTGTMDGMELTLVSVTAFAHAVVAPSGFNATGTTLTCGGAKGDGGAIVAYAGKWYTKNTRNFSIT